MKRQRKDQIIEDDTTRNKATFFIDTYTRFEKSLLFFFLLLPSTFEVLDKGPHNK